LPGGGVKRVDSPIPMVSLLFRRGQLTAREMIDFVNCTTIST